MFGLMLAGVLAFGKSTRLVVSWTNPAVTHPGFHKVLVVGMSNNPGIRADFEDALAAKLTAPGLEAIAGNTLLLRPEGTKPNLDYLRAQVKENHIDAVLVSRLISAETKITYVPGQNYIYPYPYYRSFYGYYGEVYPAVYSPDYLREDTTVRVETNLYSTNSEEGELVWTAVSDTFNPRSAAKAIQGISQLVAGELKKQGLL